MTRTKTVVAIGSFLGLATLPLGAQQAERVSLRGSEIAVYNLAGRVTVERASGGDVVVEVTRRGADAAQLRIETGPLDGRETLRIRYPGEHVTYAGGREGHGSNSTMRVRDDGTFGDSDGGHKSRRDGREVRVTTRSGGLEAHADLHIRMPPGQKLSVYLGVGHAGVTGVDGDVRVDAGAADVSATRTRGALVLDTGSGEIELTDAEGDIMLDTGSGQVHVTRARGPKLLIDTGSGEVTVDGAEVDELIIDTGSGSVDATAVRSRDILVDTGSGSVNVSLVGDVESLNVDTGSGGVTISLPPSAGATVEIETGSGDIELGFPVQTTRMSRSHLEGKIGDGQGRIVVDTGSGSVRLRRS